MNLHEAVKYGHAPHDLRYGVPESSSSADCSLECTVAHRGKETHLPTQNLSSHPIGCEQGPEKRMDHQDRDPRTNQSRGNGHASQSATHDGDSKHLQRD